jgi:hypothetical protein
VLGLGQQERWCRRGVGDDSLPYFAQAAGRLAPRLDVDITRVPGTHFGYLDHPAQLAQTVSALLSERRPLTNDDAAG